MGLDRAFHTPTIEVDQDKYDELIKYRTLYYMRLKEEKERKEANKNMKKIKVMISQPMKNKTQEEIKEERAELVKELEEKGYEVIDTIFTDEPPKDSDYAIYLLSKSIEAMSKVDSVVFMEGWREALGCKIEYEIAMQYHKFVKEL